MAGQVAMALRDVRFGYRANNVVLDSLDADLLVGTVTALIGPNASGKSTLLRIMIGQLQPDTGKIELAGTSLSDIHVPRRAKLISYVPQHSALAFDFTVRQVIEMGRYVYGPGGDALNSAIDLCGLHELCDRVYMHLSAGQQQRVLLARAMAQSYDDGAIMLLDEPVCHMDLWHIHRSMQLLRYLAHHRRLAVLVVLHDLNLAVQYADDVWLLANGRLEATGTQAEVLRTEVLEPVFQVRLHRVTGDENQRELFFVEHDDTLI